MPSLRKRVSSYFRQLSFYNEPREKKQNINENSFVTKYLEGHISIKEGPPILYGKNPTDLPNYDLAVYDVGPNSIIGCFSGPNGGLTTVKRLEKHLSIPDTDIDFIDTQDEPEVPVSPPVLHKSPHLMQNKQTVDNMTMVIKVAGQEYLVTNRKKPDNKSHSLGSLSDLEIEIEKTKICTESCTNNNNSNDVKCKNQELANSKSDNQNKLTESDLNENENVSQKVVTKNHNKNIDTSTKRTSVQKTAHSKRSGGARRKSKSPDRPESSRVSYGLGKSKSEGNPFQHKKKGKIIRISSRPTAHADTISTSGDARPDTVDPSLPEDWNRKSDYVFGISDSLYDRNQVTKNKNGDPIADCFGIIARNDSAILAVADGVNWGEKASIAAKSAVHGCLHYLDKTIFNDTKPFDDLSTKTDTSSQKQSAVFNQNRISNTREVFICLLRAFNCAHDLILENDGMLTTLTVAVVLPLKSKNVKAPPKAKGDSLTRDKDKIRRPLYTGRNVTKASSDESMDSYVCCVCNVGDTLAYVYSQKYGVRELTKGSHDVNSNRDMRDALGALGPVDGINPELSNLTLSVTVVQKGDIILVASDGLTDNFDPNVCKFTVNSKETTTRLKRLSASKEGHHNKENINIEGIEKGTNTDVVGKPSSSQEMASATGTSSEAAESNKAPVKPPRKNKDNISKSSRERSIDSLEGKLDSASHSDQKLETSQNTNSLSHKQNKDNLVAENDTKCSSKENVSSNILENVKSNQPNLEKTNSSHQAVPNSDLGISSTKASNKSLSKQTSGSLESNRKKSSTSNERSDEYDNPLVAQFMRENSLDEKSNLDKSKKTPDKKGSLDSQHKTSVPRKPLSSHTKTVQQEPKTLPNQPKVHIHKTASRNIPLNKTMEQRAIDLKRSTSKVRDLPTSSNKTNVTGFLRSKTSLDMRTSAKTILRNEDGVPFVTPMQRYEISLLLMEDILKHGISGHDSQCTTAKKVCENLVNFTFSISSAKRHTLEDADLYFDNVSGVLVEVSQQEKKQRRRKGLEKVQNLPGKLDHVSVVAYNVGNFANTY